MNLINLLAWCLSSWTADSGEVVLASTFVTLGSGGWTFLLCVMLATTVGALALLPAILGLTPCLQELDIHVFWRSCVGWPSCHWFQLYTRAASSARQMSMALERVRSACFNKRDLVLSLITPHTKRSLVRLSVRVPNSHVLTFLRKNLIVTYWSTVSPGCWFRVLKSLTFFLGIQ